MESLLQNISHILQNVATGITILSVFIAVLKEKYNDNKYVPGSTKYPIGHKEVFQPLKWIIRICLIVYIIATCVLLYLQDIPNKYIISTFITFIVLVIGFIYLSIQGKKSLDSRFIIAPKELWQKMFNRIPSYLEECDGPFRIYILKIGVEEDASQMSDIDNILTDTIKKQIDDKIEDIKRSKNGQTFRDEDNPLYDIILNDDPFYHRTDKDNIHGIIVFIGNAMATDKVNLQLSILADKFPNASIGYYSYGSYPADLYPPYINLKHLRVEDYIDHLVFRYYARSKAWQRLSNSYHTSFKWLVSIITLFIVAIAGYKMIQNYQYEHSKIVLSAPERSVKSNFTRLVNSILDNPKPFDVKLWKKIDTVGIVNTHRYAEQGDTNKHQNFSSLIAMVIEADVFLLYDKSQDSPYMVWTGDGKECEGIYYPENDAFSTWINGQHYLFKWEPSRKGRKTYDDMRIRVMYSIGNNAVEVIYGNGDSKVIRKAAKHSDEFLLPIQQFLIATSLEDMKLDK